jgi:hypothetical protein
MTGSGHLESGVNGTGGVGCRYKVLGLTSYRGTLPSVCGRWWGSVLNGSGAERSTN